MLLVPIAKNTDLVVLVLIEVEAVGLPVPTQLLLRQYVINCLPQLQEIVIERLLGYSYFLSCIFQSDALVHVQPSPLTHFDHYFSNNALLLAPASLSLACLCAALDESVCIFAACLLPELQLDLVGRLLDGR